MTYRELVTAVRGGADQIDTLDELSRAALAEGEEEDALTLLRPAAERLSTPLVWQWVSLLQRSIEDHGAAMQSFERAAILAPSDPRIAHGRAQAALEAGCDAVELFELARGLAPSDGAIAIGLAAAKQAMARGEEAAGELRALLEQAPAWTDGYQHLAQLMAVLGRKERASEAVEQAIALFPREQALWLTLFDIDIKLRDYAALARNLDRATFAGIPDVALAPYRAIAAAELAEETFPAALFSSIDGSEELGIWRIRHLLRVGALEPALQLIDRELASERAWSIWPYASIAWRLCRDARAHWLEGDPRLVQVSDISRSMPPLDELASHLLMLHRSGGEFIDQSVRGGTQTDGPLLSHVEPVLRHLRRAIEGAVRLYIDKLPETDPTHPTLAPRRDRRIRFSGSWSVRLRGGGRHANHVHPQGWISAALYIGLPERSADDPEDAGWLTIGEPEDALGLNLPPSRKLEPKPGRLVLFPSWMWHGTVPFAAGERLTVAFDVAHPR